MAAARRRYRLPSIGVALCAVVLWPSHTTAQSGGSARLLRVPSAALGETRTVHVQLPPNYALAKQRYPVVVMLDGQVRAFFDLTVAATNYDLSSESHPFAMPPQIVVAVEQGERAADLVRNADAFLRFLTTELLPKIDREYRTIPFRTLIGHSLGGRFALFAMCRAPIDFPAIIAISASLPDSTAAETTRCIDARGATSSAPATMRHLVIAGGSLEPRTLANTDRLFANLTARAAPHWRMHRVDATGLEHTGTPLVAIPLGLRFVYDASAWSMPVAIADSLRQRLGDPEKLLASGTSALSGRLGVTLAPSAAGMASVVRTYIARRDTTAARAAAERLLAAYPEQILSHTLLADSYELSGNLAATRKAIAGALELSNRIVWFDETQKSQEQAKLRRALADRTP